MAVSVLLSTQLGKQRKIQPKQRNKSITRSKHVSVPAAISHAGASSVLSLSTRCPQHPLNDVCNWGTRHQGTKATASASASHRWHPRTPAPASEGPRWLAPPLALGLPDVYTALQCLPHLPKQAGRLALCVRWSPASPPGTAPEPSPRGPISSRAPRWAVQWVGPFLRFMHDEVAAGAGTPPMSERHTPPALRLSSQRPLASKQRRPGKCWVRVDPLRKVLGETGRLKGIIKRFQVAWEAQEAGHPSPAVQPQQALHLPSSPETAVHSAPTHQLLLPSPHALPPTPPQRA